MSSSQKFGNYILLEKVGSGGMAELFLARQVGVKGFERILAIKRILPNLTKDSDFVEMFINEANLAAQITHPNVVQVYDFGNIDGIYFIAMEYIMGKSLADIISQGKRTGFPMPGGLACLITSKIAAGLHYAYEGVTLPGKPLRIIHRDISPQNILVSYQGEVKLVDFGIAKAVSSSSHTHAGTLKGKISYLSPEQAFGKPLDNRSDIFSLGIVLHEMLTERRLFRTENEFETLEMVRSGKIPPPSDIKPYLPKMLDLIALKALAKNPQDRYHNADAFQEALEEYLQTQTKMPSAKDLSNYLRLIYKNDISKELHDFQQITQLQQTPDVLKPAKTLAKTLVGKTKNSPVKITILALACLLILILLKESSFWLHANQPSRPIPDTTTSQPPAVIPETQPSPLPRVLSMPTTSPSPTPVSVEMMKETSVPSPSPPPPRPVFPHARTKKKRILFPASTPLQPAKEEPVKGDVKEDETNQKKSEELTHFSPPEVVISPPVPEQKPASPKEEDPVPILP